MKRHLYLTALCLFGLAMAQAQTPPPAQTRMGSESGYASIQQQCMSCHGREKMPRARRLWEFDTAKEFETVNKVAAHGGTVASAGPTIAGGMLFVASGYSFGGGGDKMGNVLLAFSPE